MMKKKFAYIYILLMIILVSSKADAAQNNDQYKEFLLSKGIKNSYLMMKGDIENVSENIRHLNITENYVFEKMKEVADAAEQMKPVNDRDIVLKNDVIQYDCIIYDDFGKIVETKSNEYAILGKQMLESWIEEEIVGKKIRETIIINKEIEIYINDIFEFKTYDVYDKDLWALFDCNSFDEYHEYCQMLVETKMREDIKEEDFSRIVTALIQDSQFFLDQDEVIALSEEYIQADEAMAYIYGLTLEEYAEQILMLPGDSYYHSVYEKGKRRLQEYLLIGDIAEEANQINSFPDQEGDIYYQSIKEGVFHVFEDLLETVEVPLDYSVETVDKLYGICQILYKNKIVIDSIELSLPEKSVDIVILKGPNEEKDVVSSLKEIRGSYKNNSDTEDVYIYYPGEESRYVTGLDNDVTSVVHMIVKWGLPAGAVLIAAGVIIVIVYCRRKR